MGIGTTVVAVNPWNVGVGSLAYDISFTAGDVGIIGTTSATQTLDVRGDLRVTGGIYDTNNVVGAANSVLTADGSGGWEWRNMAAGLTGSQGDQGAQGVQDQGAQGAGSGAQGVIKVLRVSKVLRVLLVLQVLKGLLKVTKGFRVLLVD